MSEVRPKELDYDEKKDLKMNEMNVSCWIKCSKEEEKLANSHKHVNI